MSLSLAGGAGEGVTRLRILAICRYAQRCPRAIAIANRICVEINHFMIDLDPFLESSVEGSFFRIRIFLSEFFDSQKSRKEN